MRPINAVITGAIAGGLVLILGSVAAHMLSRSVPKHDPTPAALAPAPLPAYGQAIDICRDLYESKVGCMNFWLRRVEGSETQAASAVVGNGVSRIAIYPSRDAVSRRVDNEGLRDGYGQPLDLVAGDNWIVTLVLQESEGHDRAYAVQSVIGGVVIESAEG